MRDPRRVKLTPGRDIETFIELSMKPGSWESSGIPETGCRLRSDTFEQLIASGGQYDADDLIHGLMDWLDVTDDPLPAIATLRRLLDRHYPSDGRGHATCHFTDETGFDYRLIVAPVDTGRELVSWQRDDFVFALGQSSGSEPGRIVIAAPVPLSLNAALRILAVSQVRFMEAPFDSFAGAVGMSGATGNFYALERGEISTHHWPGGLGLHDKRGRIIDCSQDLYPLPKGDWLPPNQIAMMVGIAAGYAKW